MARRRLDAEERALWRRVTRDVRALDSRPERDAGQDLRSAILVPGAPRPAALPPVPGKVALPPRTSRPAPDTLDGSWDRRLARGLVAPDMTIDLHGYTLAGAHGALEAALSRAVAQEARVLLVVTGRPPRRDHSGERPVRGVIRAAIGDWLGASPHAGRIAAVRHAHRRHGGPGALYLVLRRSVRNGRNGRIP